MTVFDLLFLLLVLASLGTFLAAAVAALLGRGARALATLRKWGLGALLYVAIVAAVGFFSPQKVLRPGDPWCFDDWCLTVERVTQAPAPPQAAYTVTLRIFSRARRVSQRAKGAWIYLIDRGGRRYPPEPDPSAVPLDVRLQPGESVTTARTFKVPADAGSLCLITGHGIPCCYPLPIIGDDASLFHKRTCVRLQ
ncbi:MAG TPA: hypothetical protein VMG35_18975 [Bryobacteraceae bacterium]|nr:hypothetical protein [Bryobacteraceae bacterium]